MGQTLSFLWKWLCTKSRNETPTDGDHHHHHHHQANYHVISLDDDDDETSSTRNQQEILIEDHCIDIPDYVEPVLGRSSISITENHDKDLDTPSHHKSKKKEKKEKQVQDDGNNNGSVQPVSGRSSTSITENHDKDLDTPSYKSKKKEKKEKQIQDDDGSGVWKIGQYNSGQKILLVGEGDFSFSACLAVAFGNAHNITATSLNSQDFLIQNYGMFPINKAELVSRGSTVLHDVDATRMKKHPLLSTVLFDRIIFNFPHAGKFGHSDSELRQHKDLVRGFLRNAKKMIKEDGEIHITSKSNGFYLNWDIPKTGKDQGLRLIQEMKFRRSKYPGYNTKYGFGGDKDFDCNPSKTYKFVLSSK